MRYLYSFILYLGLPFILLRLRWKARHSHAYKQNWHQRLGFAPTLPKGCIWIHAVSVGETVAAAPLINHLQQLYPNIELLITSMTPTGVAYASKFKNAHVHHAYVPYDLPNAIKRFIHRCQPRLLIIMETELWPNILHYTAQAGVPILLANARLSARSAKGYHYIAYLMRQMFNNITLIAAQSQDDAERFTALGAKHVEVVGNIKFDIEVPTELVQAGKLLRASWDVERPVWIAASTHAGEEEIILDAFSLLRQRLPSALLILVPRHPNRFDEVTTLCQKRGWQTQRRSARQSCLLTTAVFIGDTMGELYFYYAVADVAFVGGSLMPIGGHNVLEPAAIGLPVLSGLYMHNFTTITQLLKNANGMLLINNAQELANKVEELLADTVLRHNIGKNAQQVVTHNRGALQKHLHYITQKLTSSEI